MKRLFFIAVMLLVNMTVMAQGGAPPGGMPPGGGGMPGGGGGGRPPMMNNDQQEERVKVMATSITEMLKKELKLDKEQYPKVKKAYTKFINVKFSSPDDPNAGLKNLKKSLKKVLTAAQFEKWEKLPPPMDKMENRQEPPKGPDGGRGPGNPPTR